MLVWDVEQGTVAERFAGHSDAIDALDMTRRRTHADHGLVGQSRAILWDLAGDRRLDRRFAVGRRFSRRLHAEGIAVSPDGRTLAVTHDDGAVDLIDTMTLRRRQVLRALDGAACCGRLQSRRTPAGGDGSRRAHHALERADAGAGRRARDAGSTPTRSPSRPTASCSPRPRRSIRRTATQRRPLRVWDVRPRTLTGFRGRSALGSIAFSPDGTLLAAAADRRGHRDPRRRARAASSSGSTRETSRCSVAFSPDGELLFVGQYDGRGQLLSTSTWKPVGRRWRAIRARITSAAVHARRSHARHRRGRRHRGAVGRRDPEVARVAA